MLGPSDAKEREQGLASPFDAVAIGAPAQAGISTASLHPTASELGYLLFKRLLDIVAALLVFTIGLPFLFLIGIIVKRSSPGPAIYSQPRLAKGARPFRFFKFRTMYLDWPERFPHLAKFDFDPQALDQVYLQIKDDPRVTPIGRFLRRTSLDELPNFWNILRGEMTLVGPRPELPAMLPYYETLDKFTVKPGLTCFAQIQGRGELNFPDTVRLDLQYVREHSTAVDVKILLGTLRAVVGGRGSY